MSQQPLGMVYPCDRCGQGRFITAKQLVGTRRLYCKACGHEFFSPPGAREVEVAPALAALAQPDRRYPKQCYERAVEFVQKHPVSDLPPVWLVHGTFQDGYGHAWVLVGDDVVFDGVQQRFYDRESYEHEFRAVAEAMYERRSVAIMVLDTGHFGPWPQSTDTADEVEGARQPARVTGMSMVELPNLKLARQCAGLSKRELAERSGMSTGRLDELERGQTGAGPATARGLAGALGITVAALMGQANLGAIGELDDPADAPEPVLEVPR